MNTAPSAEGTARPEHFAWQIEGAYVAEEERLLVERAFLPLVGRVLDVGSGHGATLFHLGQPEGAVGLDLDEDKIRFAKTKMPGLDFVAGSALELPFPDASFDHVIIRDVIHHLPDPAPAIDEARRVLRPGGRIDVLEPCRYNPLILLHGLALKEERGELRSTMSFLTGLVGRRFEVIATARFQPLPLHRLAFHPDLGAPRLAERPRVRRAMRRLEGAMAHVMPAWAWAYLHVRGAARGSP